RAASRSRGMRISSLQYSGGYDISYAPVQVNGGWIIVKCGRSTGDARLGLGAAGLRRVFRIERAGDAHRTLRLMPDLLIGKITEDARDEQEDCHSEPR